MRSPRPAGPWWSSAGLVTVALVATLLTTVATSLLAVAAPVAMPAASTAPEPTPVTTAARALVPQDVATGPDGNIWFTSGQAGRIGFSGYIGRVTPAGVLTTFDAIEVTPGSIVAGPDGNMWFTNRAAIGRITMAGAVTLFPLSGSVTPTDLAVGADGNLWFVSRDAQLVGRMTTAGDVTIVLSNLSYPESITAGPDGNLWFLTNDETGGGVVRVTTDGVDSGVRLGFGEHGQSLTGGPDGNIWFTVQNSLAIRRITPTLQITEFPDPTPGTRLSIAAGPDGNLWYSRFGESSLGRMTTSGVATSVPLPTGIAAEYVAPGPGGSVAFTSAGAVASVATSSGAVTSLASPGIVGPKRITAGPDGNMWFTNVFVQGFTSPLLPDAVSRITPEGIVTSFTDPLIRGPGEIVVGPDGALWVTASSGIIRVTTSGEVSKVVDGVYGSMTMGADGNLWVGWSGTFTRVTAAGVATTFTDAAIGYVRSVTSGPDGALWFLSSPNPGTVRRMTLDGVVSTFPTADTSSGGTITTGADGNLWFTQLNRVGRLTPSGTYTAFPVEQMDFPGGISGGPDGDVWFIDGSSSRPASVAQIAPDGTITHHVGNDDLPYGAAYIAAGADGGIWVTNTDSGSILHVDAPGRTATPGPPTTVTATAGEFGATVAWTAPVWPGTSPITAYIVTASPGGATCAWTAGPLSCVITGLTHGATSTFTVTATNAAGAGPPSWPSLATRIVKPGLSFHAMAPVRVLDSRGPTGGWATALQAGAPKPLVVAGAGSGAGSGVPATAGAVVLNVTATESTANSFLTISPTGTPSTTSSLSFGVGQTIPNLVTVAVGTGGSITMATAAGSVHVVADLVGYYDTGAEAGFTAMSPHRILDSRQALGSWNAPLTSETPRTLPVRGAAGVPDTADAVVVNVTATNSTANSFLTVYPTGDPPPNASNLNFAAGETIPNLVTVKIGADGKIAFATAAGAVDVVADVVGFYDTATGDRFHPITTTRLLDSRTTTGGWTGPLAASAVGTLAVAGTPPIFAEATALVANATVTGSTTNSFLTLFPDGSPPPATSNLNFGAGQTIPNMVVVKLGTTGGIGFRNAAGTVDVVLDAAGYFAPI